MDIAEKTLNPLPLPPEVPEGSETVAERERRILAHLELDYEDSTGCVTDSEPEADSEGKTVFEGEAVPESETVSMMEVDTRDKPKSRTPRMRYVCVRISRNIRSLYLLSSKLQEEKCLRRPISTNDFASKIHDLHNDMHEGIVMTL